jgi:type II secretory pathway component GspD/PulD (secretin)
LCGTVIDKSGFLSNRVVSSEQGGGVDAVATSGTSAPSINDLVSRHHFDMIVYQGSPVDIRKLEKLLEQLDQPTGEVLVKAVIYEVRKESRDNNAVSVAFGLLDSARGLGARLALGVLDATNAVRLRLHNVDAAFSVLSEDVRFRAISAPTVRVRSGESARFQAGAEVPTLGAVTHNGNGQSVQSVEYRASGVILDLLPEIHEKSIDLTITHQLSSFVTTSTINTSPTLLKRELKTVVTVEDDALLILGGLEENTETHSEKGFSFLPDSFRGRQLQDDRTEIMLVLHVKRI